MSVNGFLSKEEKESGGGKVGASEFNKLSAIKICSLESYIGKEG